MIGFASRGTAQRAPGLDAFRGLCILMVVLIHASGPVEDRWFQQHVIDGVARLGVPGFLLLSGYLAQLRGLERDRARNYFLVFLKLHVIYGAFYWAVSILRGLPQDPSLKGVVLHFAEGSYPGQYYFLILVQLYFATAYLLPSRYWARPRWLLLSILAVAGGMLMSHTLAESGLLAGIPGPARRPFTSQSMIWFWVYYFCLGGTIAKHRERLAELTPPQLLLLAGLAVALSAFGLPAPLEDFDLQSGSYVRLNVYLATSALAPCLPWMATRLGAGLLGRLGTGTFGIFVLNPAALYLLRDVLGVPETVADALLCWLVAVAIAWPAGIAVRRWLAFAHP